MAEPQSGDVGRPSWSPADLSVELNPRPRSVEERRAILEAPVFGQTFTDHMVTMTYADGVWGPMALRAFGDITLSPAALALHYGQSIFEALKAYAFDDGRIGLFRPSANAVRMDTTARRIAMPPLPDGAFEVACALLAEVDREWVPHSDGAALYIRPFMFASEPHLSVRPADQYIFSVIASPVASYFGSGIRAISVAVESQDVRASVGGTGSVKFAGNYAAGFAAHLRAGEAGHDQVLWLDSTERRWVEELNAMNVMFVWDGPDGPVLSTPPLDGTILEGITRDALLTLARSTDGGTPRFADVVEERISIDRVEAACRDESLLEMFACGTAAVIAPIGTLTFEGRTLTVGDGRPGPVTMAMRDALLAVQYGRASDPNAWMATTTDLLGSHGIDLSLLVPADDRDPVVFGLATRSEVGEIAALVQSAYRGDASRKGWTTEADFLEGQRVDEPMVLDILDDPDAVILTARSGRRLVGCCELRVHEVPEGTDDSALTSAYLGMFAVDPAIQAAGLGRRILGEAEQRVARLWGAQRLVITVIGLRSELIAWYERRGFRLTGNTSAFPYEDQRFGVPLRDDLEFVELAKLL